MINLGTYLNNVRENKPLIHNITNYVTVNDCANILLACGASPVMADDIKDATEIQAICTGLNISIGTLNEQTIPAMQMAGKKANELSHPVVLDPVGVGASSLRTDTAINLINNINFNVIKGNISEIKVLSLGCGAAKGVDADINDKVTDENISEVITFAKNFADRTHAVVAITGATDIIADATHAAVITNGHPMMSTITGSGCMLSALTTAFICANQNDIFGATVAAFCSMGLCGELAASRLTPQDGNSTYRNYLIDAIFNLDQTTLDKGAKYEMR